VIASGVNQVQVDIPAKGKAEDKTRTMLGMFGECPEQPKYALILTKDHGWAWRIDPLTESEEL